MKQYEKAVLYGNDTEYYRIRYNKPIAEIVAKYPQTLKKDILNFIKKHEGKGYRILNTNIPQYLYN